MWIDRALRLLYMKAKHGLSSHMTALITPYISLNAKNMDYHLTYSRSGPIGSIERTKLSSKKMALITSDCGEM